MKIVYIAGPFRASTAWGIAENVRAAERIGLEVARHGAMPLIPHANTAHFHGEGSDQVWIDGTLELLRRCDAAVFIPGWPNSSGSRGEWSECVQLQMPRLDLANVVFESDSAKTQRHLIDQALGAWLRAQVLR